MLRNIGEAPRRAPGNGSPARGQPGQAGRTSGSRGASSARGRLRRGRALESVREVGPQVGRPLTAVGVGLPVFQTGPPARRAAAAGQPLPRQVGSVRPTCRLSTAERNESINPPRTSREESACRSMGPVEIRQIGHHRFLRERF